MELTLNGKQIKASEGKSVLDVINDSKTYIPQLCKDPDMKPIGACRTCLVEIDGINGVVASCSVKAQPDMKIWTDTQKPKKIRKGDLELTLRMLPKNKSKSYKVSAPTTYPMKKGVKPTIQNSNPKNLSHVN